MYGIFSYIFHQQINQMWVNIPVPLGPIVDGWNPAPAGMYETL